MITLEQLVVINDLVRKLSQLRVALRSLQTETVYDVPIQVMNFNSHFNLSLVIASTTVSREAIIELIVSQVDDIVAQLATLGVEA